MDNTRTVTDAKQQKIKIKKDVITSSMSTIVDRTCYVFFSEVWSKKSSLLGRYTGLASKWLSTFRRIGNAFKTSVTDYQSTQRDIFSNADVSTSNLVLLSQFKFLLLNCSLH
jgi:hypothetical protein